VIKPGQIVHIHSVRLDSNPLISFQCMWFAWSQEISIILPKKKRRKSKDSNTEDEKVEILRCHDNRSKRNLPNTSPLLLHLRREEHEDEGRHSFVVYAPYWVKDRTGLGLIYGVCSANFKGKDDKAKKEENVRHIYASALQNHSVVEEVFENQRRRVVNKKEWEKPWLPADRPEWTDATGYVDVDIGVLRCCALFLSLLLSLSLSLSLSITHTQNTRLSHASLDSLTSSIQVQGSYNHTFSTCHFLCLHTHPTHSHPPNPDDSNYDEKTFCYQTQNTGDGTQIGR